jgi:cytochrome c oxidase subunit II
MNFICQLLGLPASASAHGLFIDHMLEVVHWFMLVLFVGWSAFLAYCLVHFRRSRNPKASYIGSRSKFSTHVEFSVVAIEVLLLLGFAFPLWAKQVSKRQFPDPAKSVVVHAVAEQFGWNFHYAGADGVFGRRSILLVSAGNPVGLDPKDPAGADDILVKNSMSLPTGKPAIIYISSKDVIHNYDVTAMRVAQDAIPGMQVPIHFEPTKEGTYEIVCAQLCGSGHANMVGVLEIVSPDAFASWLKGRAPTPPAPAPAQVSSKIPEALPKS